MHCNPTSARGHGYIIVAVDYFTKWVEAMPTYVEDGNTSALFLFNHVIARFGFPHSIVTNYYRENFLWLGVYHNRQRNHKNQSLPDMQEK